MIQILRSVDQCLAIDAGAVFVCSQMASQSQLIRRSVFSATCTHCGFGQREADREPEADQLDQVCDHLQRQAEELQEEG